jgi:histidine triad (HIT) family protein
LLPGFPTNLSNPLSPKQDLAYHPGMTRHTLQSNPTIFGKILRKEIPAKIVYEDEQVLAFHDIAPKAPIHVVIIPKQHLAGVQEATTGDEALLGHLLVTANKIAAELGVQATGYRLITNAGSGAGQEVPHLHIHLLANQPGTTAKLPGF